MRSHRGTYSTTAPPTFLLIPGMPSPTSSIITTPTSTENVRVYLVIAIFIYIDIVYK